MQRFGISLFFTNIVFHSSVGEILAPAIDNPNWNVSSNNDSLGEESDLDENPIRNQGLFKLQQSILVGSHPGKLITKCCPWGTTFDVNSLTCKKGKSPSRTEFLRKRVHNMVESEFEHDAFGVPNCLETVLYSAVADELDLSLDVEISPDEYCIDEDDGNLLMVTCGDPQEVCKVRPCIRKCKPFGEFYGEYVNGTGEVAFAPVFYNLSTLKPDDSVTVSRFGILFGMDCEGGKIRLDKEKSDVNYIGTNGSLYAPGHREFQVFTQNEFCIDYVYNEGIFTFLCPPVEEEKIESVESYILLGLGFIASCVCLFATLVVYLCSKMSRSLYGKTLMSYVGCLCVAYLSLAVVHLGNHYLKKGACILLGYSILLSFLAAFFWLNVMSVDIWKTFRILNGSLCSGTALASMGDSVFLFLRETKRTNKKYSVAGHSNSKTAFSLYLKQWNHGKNTGSLRAAEWRNAPENRSRFTAYSIYAWGSPLTITSICGILDTMPESSAPFYVHKFKPDIGSTSCWFSRSSYGMYIFFIAPVSLIITCNVILYVNTAWRCWRVRADINKLDVHSGKSRGKYSMHRDQLILNGKLFIVMGVSWGPEFISTILPHPLWKITDAMNTLLGVFIFIIFVLKKKMINNMSQRVRDSFTSLSKRGKSSDFQMDQVKRGNTCASRISRNTNPCTTNV